MKVKLDFVTNSSSSAYIMSLQNTEIADFLEYIERLDNENQNEGVRVWQQFNTKKELYEYATDKPYDWVSKAMEPRLVSMDQESFDKALKCINDGCIVMLVAVDYNACEEFEISQYERDIVMEMD